MKVTLHKELVKFWLQGPGPKPRETVEIEIPDSLWDSYSKALTELQSFDSYLTSRGYL